jgi:hypothetical protein
VVKQEFETMLPYTEQTQFVVDDSEIEVIVRDNRHDERMERFQEGMKKTGKVIRDTGRKAVNEAKKLLDSFFGN